jgi:ribosomal protein L15
VGERRGNGKEGERGRDGEREREREREIRIHYSLITLKTLNNTH